MPSPRAAADDRGDQPVGAGLVAPEKPDDARFGCGHDLGVVEATGDQHRPAAGGPLEPLEDLQGEVVDRVHDDHRHLDREVIDLGEESNLGTGAEVADHAGLEDRVACLDEHGHP